MTPFDEDLQRARAGVLAARTDDELLDALGIGALGPEGYWSLIVWRIMRPTITEPMPLDELIGKPLTESVPPPKHCKWCEYHKSGGYQSLSCGGDTFVDEVRVNLT